MIDDYELTCQECGWSRPILHERTLHGDLAVYALVLLRLHADAARHGPTIAGVLLTDATGDRIALGTQG